MSRPVDAYAHDFNNLLVGVKANARLLLEENLVKEGGEELLAQILVCVERAAFLTQEMQGPREGRAISEQPKPAEAVSISSSESEPLSEEVLPVDDGVINEERNTVLVIDDEAIVRDVAKAILLRAGFQVVVAESGEEGLILYESYSDNIGCVLLDLAMPYMGGRLVYAKLKAIKPDVRVLFMSGYSAQHLKSELNDKDFPGFIQKPFGPRVLVNQIKKLMSDQSSTPGKAATV